MSDTPIRSHSALELLEAHAKALEALNTDQAETIERLRDSLRATTIQGHVTESALACYEISPVKPCEAYMDLNGCTFQPEMKAECRVCGGTPCVIVHDPENRTNHYTDLCGPCFWHDRTMADWEKWNNPQEHQE